jgi:hypothetical protein
VPALDCAPTAGSRARAQAPRPAAAELMGVHGNVDAARATLSAA